MDKKQTIELVGIIAVVLSLIFVGFEINQNTNVARNQAYSDFTHRAQELGLQVASDDVLPVLLSRIYNGELQADFSMEDHIRIVQLFTSAVRAWESQYRSVQSGLLPADALVGVGGGLLINNDYFRASWPGMKAQYTEDFVSYFEDQPWNR